MADLPPLKYGKVVGRFLSAIADGPDVDDTPDFVPLSGTVTFTPRVAKVLVTNAEPDPATVFPKAITVPLDEFGYLTWRGKRGVWLLAPVDGVNPAGWSWQAQFNLHFEGQKITAPAFDFHLPVYDEDDPSTVVDMTLASTVPGYTGDPIVRGPRGNSVVDIALSTAGDALEFTIDSETGTFVDTVEMPALPLISDAQTAATTATGAASTATTKAGEAAASAAAAAQSAQDAADVVLDGVPNASATQKGGIRLTGDLGGTWDSPTVPGLAGKADREYGDIIASYSSGDFNSLDFTTPGVYRVRTGTGYVTNGPSTSDLWWNVLVAYDGATASKLFFATTTNANSIFARVKYGSTWGSWINLASPYSAMSVSEGTAGSSSTARVINASILKQVINFFLTGSESTGVSTIGKALATAADAASGRSTLQAVGDSDSRLSDTRTPSDNSVTNAKVAANAAIALSKLATGYVQGSANGTARTLTMWIGTEAQYNAIGTKDANTIYFRTA